MFTIRHRLLIRRCVKSPPPRRSIGRAFHRPAVPERDRGPTVRFCARLFAVQLRVDEIDDRPPRRRRQPGKPIDQELQIGIDQGQRLRAVRTPPGTARAHWRAVSVGIVGFVAGIRRGFESILGQFMNALL